MYYLIDTNIIIDHLRGDEEATSFLQKIEENSIQACISVITEYELLSSSKLSQTEEKKIREFIFNLLPSLTVTSQTVSIAASFHRKYNIGLADAIIAATAYSAHATLITRNTKHFKSIKEIHIKHLS